MTDDLVTRLLALADDIQRADSDNFAVPAARAGEGLREAAAEIKRLRGELATTNATLDTVANEAKDHLDKKDERITWLCEQRDGELRRAEEAEASECKLRVLYEQLACEAAALREAAAKVRAHSEGCIVFDNPIGCSCGLDSLRAALSQPGPGAAYQAYVKKLEAVADELLAFVEYFGAIEHGKVGGSRPSIRTFEKILLDSSRKSLAALKEKP